MTGGTWEDPCRILPSTDTVQ